MPRRTYRHRLQDLIDNPAISGRDLSFAQSLLSYYERKGSLTSGRVGWVKTLEDRYSAENLAANAAKGATMLERLNAVCERTEDASWARGFINSLQGQIMAGRKLSEKQIKTLSQIEKDHDDAALSARATFAADYSADKDGMRSDALVVAHYYRPTGYFRLLSEKMIENPAFVPSVGEYNKMVKNKYAQKVLREHHADPKYPVGSYVVPRAAHRTLKYKLGDKPCIVVEANAAPITSAAKGSKVYKLLPIGRAKTVLVEERQIMKARKVK
jgi:hypothetical protein